jgi:tetratricopeptide (TPR) repeat protein
MTSTRWLHVFALSIFVPGCIITARSQATKPPPPLPMAVSVEKSPAITFSATKTDYTREPSVLDRLDTVYTYAADGTGSKELTAVAHIQDESAIKAWSVLSFAFASSAEHVEIDYVRHADGTVVETPVTDAQEQPTAITREAPFYSDLKEKQIPVRGLRSGDHLEYKVRTIRTKPEAPGHFWGQENLAVPTDGAVVLEQTLELHIPKASYVQVWSPKNKSTLTETPTEHVYTWHSAQLQPIAGLDKAALHDLLAADPPDTDGKFPSVAWTNFHDWAEVGAWYRDMEGTRIAPDDDVRAKAAELTAGKKTDEEKVRAIYGFVGPQIRYIGVAFGVGRYQPHEAGEVLRNQYGDCKDKHTLLAALLSAAGITTDAALIGPGIRFNEALPSPGAFDHAITVVHLDGASIWLDSTAEIAPYRMLMSTIRDKQALVIPASGTAHIERTSKALPFPAEIHFTAEGSLEDNGTSHSHMVMVLRGDDELPFRQAARSVSPSQYDQLMQNISHNMSYAGTVTHAEFSRPDDTMDAFRITYDYEREKNGDWDDLRIIPQLMPIVLGPVDEKDLPVSPIELGAPHVEIDHAVMTLPKDWGADLPPAVHAKSAFATLDKTYKLEDGKLITDRRFEVLQEKIPAANWRDYKRWYTDASLQDGEPFIQLTRTSVARASGIYDPKAMGLVHDAALLAESKNWDAATKKLDEAKAINPRQADLWTLYGGIAMMKGMSNEAVEDFQRELVNHPDEPKTYMALAQTQSQQQHKPQDAIATLQKLVALVPGNEQATYMLGSLLITEKDDPGAEKVLRNALITHPGDPKTEGLLSMALIHEGKKNEAELLLKAVAETSKDPVELGAVAATLADENLNAPLAEQTARHSLALFEEQTASTPHSDSDKAPLQQAKVLLKVWDTIGWALFQEGKFAEAEPYVRAAWLNDLTAESGYHLGMILEKQSQPAKAMAVYQIALFGDRGSKPEVIADANIERQAALRKAGTPKQVEDGKMALQAQRTFKLPNPNTITGWAAVQIEFTAHGAANAKIVEDSKASSSKDNHPDALTPVLQSLNQIDFKAGPPPGSQTTITRRGILSCHTGSCEFVLLSARAALSN